MLKNIKKNSAFQLSLRAPCCKNPFRNYPPNQNHLMSLRKIDNFSRTMLEARKSLGIAYPIGTKYANCHGNTCLNPSLSSMLNINRKKVVDSLKPRPKNWLNEKNYILKWGISMVKKNAPIINSDYISIKNLYAEIYIHIIISNAVIALCRKFLSLKQ